MSQGYLCIRNSNLFVNLVDDHIEKVGEKLHHLSLAKGQMLFSGAKPLMDIYFIRRGRIKIYSMTDGRESILEILTTGDTFGSFSANNPRKGLYAEALDDAAVCRLDLDQFNKLIVSYPEIATSIIEELTTRLDQAHQKLSNITLGDAQTKVFTELQRLSQRLGKEYDSDYREVGGKFSHQQIADMVGLSRESVSHSFTKLRKQGKIKSIHDNLLVAN